jgi:hypothetical protein
MYEVFKEKIYYKNGYEQYRNLYDITGKLTFHFGVDGNLMIEDL